MQRSLSLFLLIILVPIALLAQSAITPYHERNDFLFTSPGAMKFGLYGYDNPALLSYIHQPDVLFTWSDATANWSEFKRWGLFIGIPHVGFGTVHEKTPIGHYANYSLALAVGDRTLSTGITYGWTRAGNPTLDKSSILTLGTLYRPLPFVSAGVMYTGALNIKGYELVGDLAGRPFGNELVTIFADYVLHRTPQLNKDMWSAGVTVEAMPGVRVTGRYFNTDEITLGFQFSLGNVGLETQAHYNEES